MHSLDSIPLSQRLNSYYHNCKHSLRLKQGYLYFLGLLILALLLSGMLFVTQIGKGKAALTLTVAAEPNGILAVEDLYRVSINRNLVQDFAIRDTVYAIEDRYFIGLGITESVVSQLNSVEVSLSDETQTLQKWQFSPKQLQKDPTGQTGNPITFNSEQTGLLFFPLTPFKQYASILRLFYPKIGQVINYKEDTSHLYTLFILSVLFLILLIFLIIPLGIIIHFYLQNPPVCYMFEPSWATIFSGTSAFTLLVLASMPIVFSQGNSDVQNAWLGEWWMGNFSRYGFIDGYIETGDNSPPLAFMFLGVLKLLSGDSNALLLRYYKASLLGFSLILSAQVFFYSLRFSKGKRFGMQISFLNAFVSYASLVISLSHGYQDIYYMPFLFGSFSLLQQNKTLRASLYFFLAMSWKWQPLLFLPIFFVYLLNILGETGELKYWYRSNRFWKAISPIPLGLFLCSLIFGIDYGFNLLKAFTRHGDANYDALNALWLAVEIAAPPWLISLSETLFLASFFSLLLKFLFYRDYKQTFPFFALLTVLPYFLLHKGVHQNHLLVVFVPALLVLTNNLRHEKKFSAAQLIFASFWLLYQNVNLLFYAPISSGYYSGILGPNESFWLQTLIILLALYLFFRFLFFTLTKP